MFRLFTAVIATSVALGLSAGVATAADTAVQKAPSEPKTMWQSCARIGETDRDLCMVNVTAKNSAVGRQCEELMGRAQRRCMLEFLEVKPPVPGAK
jgi:hypothetical protein